MSPCLENDRFSLPTTFHSAPSNQQLWYPPMPFRPQPSTHNHPLIPPITFHSPSNTQVAEHMFGNTTYNMPECGAAIHDRPSPRERHSVFCAGGGLAPDKRGWLLAGGAPRGAEAARCANGCELVAQSTSPSQLQSAADTLARGCPQHGVAQGLAENHRVGRPRQ